FTGDLILPSLSSLLVLSGRPEAFVGGLQSLSDASGRPSQVLPFDVGRHTDQSLHVVTVVFANHLIRADSGYVADQHLSTILCVVVLALNGHQADFFG